MDNTIFVSVFNLGCIEIAENHIISLLKNNINNYLAYVTDEESFNILNEKGYNVKYYSIEKINSEKMDFGTEGFNFLCYIRYKIINELLNEGKIVWMLDVDTVVLHDLNKLIPEFSDKDIVMQNDINMPCCGCMLFYPNIITKHIPDFMYNCKSFSHDGSTNDQIILAQLLIQNQTSIKTHLLDHEMFANGLLYFNELSNNHDFRKIQLDFKKTEKPLYFVHANWMVGIDTKINALKNKGLWYL
jgi:lipopolysaccharide biosynthesis glycosyltransferase